MVTSVSVMPTLGHRGGTRSHAVIRLLFAVAIAALVACATAGASTKRAVIAISFARSSCEQLPTAYEGGVRFFIELVNRGNKRGRYAPRIYFVWLGMNGWKGSSQNAIRGGHLTVGAHRRKRLILDFDADPTDTIIGCGLRIGNSRYVHRIKVLR